MDGERWPSDWIRAALPLVVLSVLHDGDAHGYVLLQRLREIGLGSLRGSTLYPLLARQEELGRVTHRWEPDSGGPPRKVFALTDTGRRDLVVLGHDWQGLNKIVTTAVNAAVTVPTSTATGTATGSTADTTTGSPQPTTTREER